MNKFEHRSRDSYNKKADDYENTADGRFTVKFKQALVSLIDVSNETVLLDIACGNGRLLNNFSKKATIKGLGIDISEKMIEQAKMLNPDMEFQLGSCEKLPFADSYCDIATVCASFHHFPNVNAFAREASRVVKKGGMLYIAEIYLPSFLRNICNPFIKFSKAGDVRFYSPNEIVELFERNGFDKTNIIIDGNIQIVVLQRL